VEPGIGSLANDKIIHERARLLILTYLASRDAGAVSFGEIRDALEFTPGNLSVQLKTLAEAGYISITKEFKNNKPLTQAGITQKGGAALKQYLGEMDSLIKRLRNSPPTPALRATPPPSLNERGGRGRGKG
jgi:DNA-binding HxlR family transcriptional regulator